MRGLWRVGEEVPDVVGFLAIGEGVVLLRVDEVGELDAIADEEDGRVVSDEVPVAVLRVDLEGEASRVARRVRRAARAGDGREADEHRGALARGREDLHLGPERHVLVRHLEIPVGARAHRMDDPLRNALAVEARELLDQVVVLQQHRSRDARGLGVLVVDHRCARFGGQRRTLRHMGLTLLARAWIGPCEVWMLRRRDSFDTMFDSQ